MCPRHQQIAAHSTDSAPGLRGMERNSGGRGMGSGVGGSGDLQLGGQSKEGGARSGGG